MEYLAGIKITVQMKLSEKEMEDDSMDSLYFKTIDVLDSIDWASIIEQKMREQVVNDSREIRVLVDPLC